MFVDLVLFTHPIALNLDRFLSNMYIVRILLFVLLGSSLYAQTNQRSINATRITEAIKIDGVLDEAQWINAKESIGFTQNEPKYGEACSFNNTVKILYDDKALYVAAFMEDTEPEGIVMNLTQRDDVGINDWFFIILDTYQNGLNAVGFGLTPAGVQADLQYVNDDEQYQWDAVWNSAVKVVENGWIVEVAIPYSALRFPETDIQEWNINFGRRIRRKFEKSFWNPVDPNVPGFINQAGQLNGIEHVKAPIRLSLTPFVVVGQQFSNNKSSQSYGAGMDLKYGITDAFTLDMTIIPDFSQVRSDDQVFNLTPFEVRFDENRPFFTEGTDIFNKGGFFYSRRIGQRPFYTNQILSDNNYVDVNGLNSTAQLINATKISGRNKNGTGLGFFNAVESRSYVTAINLDNEEVELLEHPLTNYNVSVVDQSLKNNSYISLINTNVMREGSAYDANLTGTEFQLRNKKQKYQLSGKAALSQRFLESGLDLGHTYFAEFAEIDGQLKTFGGINVESANYNPNDLGFLFSPNERSAYLYSEYWEFKPTNENIQRYRFWGSTSLNFLHEPFVYNSFDVEGGFFLVTKGFVGTGGNFSVNPVATHDYFEPRTADFSRHLVIPGNASIGGFVSTDYSKTLALNANFGIAKFFSVDRHHFQVNLEPRWTISSKALLIFSTYFEFLHNDEGFVNKTFIDNYESYFDEDIIAIGRRDRNILENSLSLNYIFTNKMASSLRVRHYWDVVDYNGYKNLGEDGAISANYLFDGLNEDGESVFNANTSFFNIDLNYLWRFAPGSDIIFSYRSNAFAFNKDVNEAYFDNLDYILRTQLNHTLSLKVLYFLDAAAFSKR